MGCGGEHCLLGRNKGEGKISLVNNNTPPYNVPINKEKEEHGWGRLSQMLPRRCSSADGAVKLCTANTVVLLMGSHHPCYCSATRHTAWISAVTPLAEHGPLAS